MNRHQVLTGAVNAGDHCYAVGSVEGVPFTAYAAGCDIVILASNFERVQIIPGVCHGNIQIGCLDCSTDSGKIAAAYGYQVCIFEPTPLIRQSSSHKLDYNWVQTFKFKTDCYVRNLSWNLEGTRLLTGGTIIQMWHYNNPRENLLETEMDDASIQFDVGEDNAKDVKLPEWVCIWQCRTAHPVSYLKFSPDGTLFASAGKTDRLVKIWYENKAVHFPTKSVDTQSSICSDEVNFTFIYIAHPRQVTGLAWRKTSKYMPRGAVANMLVTSCRDNICRIWVQTILPDDGLVNMQQFDPLAAQNPKFRTHRQKHKFKMHLKHMKTCFHIRRRHHHQSGQLNSPIPTLPSTFSAHDFHSFGIHGTGITPGFHFHLATSINAETDIPLVPTISTSGDLQEPNFVLHWLNNKEMHFTLHAEQILQELTKKAVEPETQQQSPVECKDQSDSADVDVEETEELKDLRHKRRTKHLKTTKASKFNKSKSVDDTDDTNHRVPASSYSLSSTTSNMSLNADSAMASSSPIGDALDRKIEALLRDWQNSPDLLFSVHPLDGSFLVWLVDWLDEYIPGSFRQAQVSFSSRIPNALPLGDAMTMSTALALYNCQTYLDLKSILKLGDVKSSCGKDFGAAPNTPVICMLSKHRNGSLNLWNITFNENSKFTQVLSVGHISRVCGHRFRVNDIACHPVLPLLLTTSHHNMPTEIEVTSNEQSCDNDDSQNKNECEEGTPVGFCSELILWRVDPVGALCHSGGVTELARINSPEITAFSNVAWIPTLLPSTTLGSLSNSPSACFVASDGHSLRIYQAVIDARTLLAEIFTAERKMKLHSESITSLSSSSSFSMNLKPLPFQESFKIVSQQSTARPGCIIQLEAIEDAVHDWHNTQFLHVFQEQLITGEKSSDKTSGLMEATLGAMVDLQQSVVFEEPFYLVVLEKNNSGETILHMWRILIASQPNTGVHVRDVTYAPDSHIVQDSDHSNPPSRSRTPELGPAAQFHQNSVHPLSISTKKVCSQCLPLPDNVEIIHAAPAAGHLSSSSIYPACFAPYLIATACSDNKVRFWYCFNKKDDQDKQTSSFVWEEWIMLNSLEESSVEISGVPLNISCAYSGRFACAYKSGKSFTRPSSENPNSRFVNLSVAIYECESTGGSEWILEDTIHLKNISLPEIKLDLDFSYLYDKSVLQKKKLSIDNIVRTLSHEDMHSPTPCNIDQCYSNLKGLITVPSFSTLQTLRKAIYEKGNQCVLTQKHLVQLDWVSTEDGSHVLTVGVGSKIYLFATVSSDLAQANIKAMTESKASSHPPVLTKASSMMVPHFNAEEIRWMKLRSVELTSADGLPPLPMQISWVRDGILVVGMDNEMHVYCQWRGSGALDTNNVDDQPLKKKEKIDLEASIDSRNLTDQDIMTIAQDGAQVRMTSITVLPHNTSASIIGASDTWKKRDLHSRSGISSETTPVQSFMPDYGLFEASRMACPVLPQYHPKQLMELLNFGKIQRVKAILAHLVRCLTGAEHKSSVGQSEHTGRSSRQRAWSRSRTLSISIPQSSSPMDTQNQSAILSEEVQLDYIEINAIPPLPLYILLAADKETVTTVNKDNRTKDYSSLFSADATTFEDDELDNILEDFDSAPSLERRRSMSGERQSLTNFGNRQARILTRLLTHTHLPGLSSLDQMHLLALADTVASCNTAFADRFLIDTIKQDGSVVSSSPENLDDCGLRFLLAMRHHSYLMRCLPPQQRLLLHKQGLSTATLIWAFHSESEEELLNVIPGVQRGDPKWSELKELGAGWWIRNNIFLKKCIEKVAKAAFQVQSNPLDAALYYLAMKKKNLVWGLFRSVRDDKMTTFFQNNFSEDRWRKAALKNAFVLLGKQRFTHAAAFFLLAGSLWDAVEVCLNKLNDLQLAMVIVRLYEGELHSSPPGLRKLLFEEILGCDKDGNNYDSSRAHPDPFLRSMAFWILSDYNNALGTLLQNDIGTNYAKLSDEEMNFEDTTSRNVFNFYVYLRTHPLLIRQHIADTAQKTQTVLLTGFTSYTGSKKISIRDKQVGEVFYEDAITPIERRLYFTTAHAHFKAGCPALALEVLSKLPSKVVDAYDHQTKSDSKSSKSPIASTSLDTGIINGAEMNWSKAVDEKNKINKIDTEIDWSQPMTFNSVLDDDPLKLDFSDDGGGGDDDDDTQDDKNGNVIDENKSDSPKPLVSSEGPVKLDIMAQQLKFVACLKIVMEELSTLATGYEVDGGQLRYQLYIWLEREVEALKELCNYSGSYTGSVSKTDSISSDPNMDDLDKSQTQLTPQRFNENPTLHEILLADKMDFEAKLQRAERRKRWLKANETLLRTLLSYCSLHGASGGGLASVRMELILLLQEFQQEKTQQQLLSPLPFPTTLPLLSASVACHKTVITDPIRHLQSMTHDILCSIIDLPSPGIPGHINYSEVLVLRVLSIALSACIYQSLCDSDSFSVKHNGCLSSGMEALASTSIVYQESHLMAGFSRRRRFSSNDEPLQPTTAPNKWPGVTSLRALLAREKDDDTPKLSILLCEAFIAVYMSLLVHALASSESHTLYRLMGQALNEQSWADLFGGGIKKLLKVSVSTSSSASGPQETVDKEPAQNEAGFLDTLVKQRMKLHMKILGQFGQGSQPPVIKEDRPTYREQFVPPEMSMANYLMTKPILSAEFESIDYDSGESLPSEEESEAFSDDDDFLTTKDHSADEGCSEHSDPNSYSWGIIRYAVVRLAQHHLQKFLNIAGLELQDMPVASPLIHSILKVLDQWLNMLQAHMDSFEGPPPDYIPGCYVESNLSGPAIQKYKAILEQQNTPFKSKQNSTLPVRRLWCYLVQQEHVQDIFIRYIFGRKKTLPLPIDDSSDESLEPPPPDPIRIIHKDQDSISSFCINKANSGIMALATTKEIQELDISVLLEPPVWLEDDCEYDILNLNRSPESLPASEYLVVQTAADRPLLAQLAPSSASSSQISQSGAGPGMVTVNMPSTYTVQTGRATTVLMKHKVDGIRRMSSHPVLPLYLTGCQDGSVRIWEWGHNQPVAVPRAPGTYAKVTRVLFNPQGNKFGISDGDGNLSLWQVGLSSNANKMFFSHQCHGKQTSDFVFVGSSSLIATAGHSAESKNVCIWDTLLPQKKSLVQAFTCHEQGCSCLVYAPQHQIIISGGKKGEIYILDVRQKQVRHRFNGHDSAIKCIALDPNEEFFVTGSADGDIKVWGLSYHNAFFTFQGEHVRNTFFRNISVGVAQLYVDTANRLFSCGGDGSMKLRQLPEKELVVHSIY